jgi:hypothetical protein
MEQTRNPHGLDLYENVVTISGLVVQRVCKESAHWSVRALVTVRHSRRFGPAATVVVVLTVR